MSSCSDPGKVRHWFPRVSHITEDYQSYEDIPEKMIVENRHDLPYIGDFPPKDDYSTHRIY